MEPRQSAYPMAAAMGKLIWLVFGVKGLASLGPFLGAPAISGAGKRYRSCGVVGLTVVLSAVRVRISADLDRRSLLSEGLCWCQLLVESAWTSVLSRSRVARRPLARLAVMVGTVSRLRVTLLRDAWLDSEYFFCVSSWRFFGEFLLFLRVGHTRILRSIHVLLPVEVAAPIVDNGSCMYCIVFAGIFMHFALCS